jgi:hypothetical protein
VLQVITIYACSIPKHPNKKKSLNSCLANSKARGVAGCFSELFFSACAGMGKLWQLTGAGYTCMVGLWDRSQWNSRQSN